jgi:GPI mannosyltransferase 3
LLLESLTSSALLNRTWEWLPGAQIRGFLHPLIFAALYKLLALVQLDTAWAVAHGPKLLQSIGAAVCDYYTHGLALKLFGRDTAAWGLLLQLASWFDFYCLCRPYSNSLEAVLTIVSLYYWTPLWCYDKQVHTNIIMHVLRSQAVCA